MEPTQSFCRIAIEINLLARRRPSEKTIGLRLRIYLGLTMPDREDLGRIRCFRLNHKNCAADLK